MSTTLNFRGKKKKTNRANFFIFGKSLRQFCIESIKLSGNKNQLRKLSNDFFNSSTIDVF